MTGDMEGKSRRRRALIISLDPDAPRGLMRLYAGVGGYRRPVRVIAFNTSEFWSRDVSEDVAWEVVKRAVDTGSRLPDATHNFVVRHLGEQVALQAENALL